VPSTAMTFVPVRGVESAASRHICERHWVVRERAEELGLKGSILIRTRNSELRTTRHRVSVLMSACLELPSRRPIEPVSAAYGAKLARSTT